MKILIILTGIFFLFARDPLIYGAEKFSGDTCDCNYKCWPATISTPDKLTADQILDFLKTLQPVCNANAEFSEFSNELLFKILEINTGLLISVLDIHKYNLAYGYILSMIEEPVHDAIDLHKITVNTRSYRKAPETRLLILRALEKASEKNRKT